MNTVILTSCAADEESLVEGSADKVMLFTQFLADGVRSLPRPLTMAAAHKYTADKMKAVLRGKPDIQEPTLTDNALLTVHLVP